MNNLINLVILVIWLISYFFIWYLHSLGVVWIVLSFVLMILWIYLLLSWWDALVDGSVSVAKKFKISPIVIGLTIVSFWTSAPEFFINVLAALKWENNLLLSNIIGSNLANLLLILWAGAIVAEKWLKVRDKTLLYEIPFSLLSAVVLAILVNDIWLNWFQYNILSRWDGLILLCFFIVFMYYIYTLIKNDKWNVEIEVKNYPIYYSLFLILLWILGLYFWGELVVNNAVWFAKKLWVSTFLIWATIVAIWTSLPELVATIISAKKWHTDVAIWNIIWSNIFNILWIWWVSSVINAIKFESKYNIDLLFLIFSTLLLIVLIYSSKKRVLSLKIWIIFVVLYFLYLAFVIWRG